MADDMRFIKKNGRVIPIRAAQGAGRVLSHKVLKGARIATAAGAAGAAAIAAKKHKSIKGTNTGIKVNKSWDLAGLGLSVASGAVAAATFGMGVKGFTAGLIGSHALDAASVGANIKGVAGHGQLKARATEGAKHETRNILVGYGVYGAGILASKGNRQAAVNYAGKILQVARKVLRLGGA